MIISFSGIFFFAGAPSAPSAGGAALSALVSCQPWGAAAEVGKICRVLSPARR
jgi:hypothetical protein